MNFNIKKIIDNISKNEGVFYYGLFVFAKKIRRFSIPVVSPLHSLLYNEWFLRTSLWHNFWRIFYYEPIFKSQCHFVGKNFRMEYAGNGSTKIFGKLKISLGENVTIFDNTVFVGLKVLESPELVVGDHTYLGPLVRIMVGKRVAIGRHCLITSKMITDNPGHPVDDVLARMGPSGGSPSPESIRPIAIGDFCFLPVETIVYPGVTVGDGVVARIGTHITRDVPPFCQVTGNPMRIVKKLPIPEELKTIVGEERFNHYLEAHRHLVV